MSEELARVTGLPPREIEDSVMERERLGSTGVGEGVAIPHARVDGIDAPIGGFMRLTSGVDFEAIDDRPCDLIFMLLAPLSAGADHLRALAQVSRVFRQSAVRDALREATTVDEVKAVICREHVDTSI
jgi:PTS system nitrogen regulatory IIA component